MRIWHGLGAIFAVGAAVIIGCSSGGNGTCVASGGAPTSGAGTADMCVIAGGTCSSSGGGISTCGPNQHPALSGSPEANSCSNNYYGDYNNNCGPYYATGAGLQPASGTCCLPDLDAGIDGSTDASDDGGDSGSGIGSCAGSPCNAGCACGIVPGPDTPACLCEGADSGADAEAPNCGSIYCFAGCTCADIGTSTCTCP